MLKDLNLYMNENYIIYPYKKLMLYSNLILCFIHLIKSYKLLIKANKKLIINLIDLLNNLKIINFLNYMN